MGFAVVLIVLKFLKKGFDTWIAWTDDPSSDPLQLTTNFGQGTCLCLDFPYIIWLVGRCYRRFNYRNNECNGNCGMTSLSDTLRSMIDTAGFTMIISF